MSYEKVADVVEEAAHLQEQQNIAGRKACEAALAPQKAEGFDGVHCIEPDCGEVLPPIRILMKRVRCANCQAEVERLAKLRRK